MIAPGVPDIHSMRAAVQMGYHVYQRGLVWPGSKCSPDRLPSGRPVDISTMGKRIA